MHRNNHYLINLFLIILIFQGCKKQKIILKNDKIKKENIIYLSNLDFQLFIENIECKLCERKVINILEKIENIQKIELNNNLDKYCVNLFLKDKKQNINLTKIIEDLKKAGFYLKSICGEFIGTFSNNGNNFKLLGHEHVYAVKSVHKNLFVDNKVQLIKGRIEFNNTTYWFII